MCICLAIVETGPLWAYGKEEMGMGMGMEMKWKWKRNRNRNGNGNKKWKTEIGMPAWQCLITLPGLLDWPWTTGLIPNYLFSVGQELVNMLIQPIH